MNTDFTNIKVGDTVILKYGRREIVAHTTKVNKATFEVNRKLFRKDNGWEYGGGTWNKWRATLPTSEEEIKKITDKNEKDALVGRIISKATYTNLFRLDTDTLRKIDNILITEREE